MIKPVIQLGNMVLRNKSDHWNDFRGTSLTNLTKDLSDTLQDAQKRFGYGRGIAAPQIGVPRRVIFIDTEKFKGPLINPSAIWKSDNKFEVWDSCFSFNVAFFVLVDRAYSIKVKFSDQQGKPHLLAANKNLSELLQHEMDHLDGILATDRIKDNKKIMMRSEWERTFHKVKHP